MGRTVPTFRQLVEQAVQRWSKFRRALLREDQRHFDRLFHYVRYYTHAATYQCDEDPVQSILLSIALGQERRLEALERIVFQKEKLDANPGMDPRSLSEPAGNEAMANRAGPETPPAD
jgi:hypothetical protein